MSSSCIEKALKNEEKKIIRQKEKLQTIMFSNFYDLWVDNRKEADKILKSSLSYEDKATAISPLAEKENSLNKLIKKQHKLIIGTGIKQLVDLDYHLIEIRNAICLLRIKNDRRS